MLLRTHAKPKKESSGVSISSFIIGYIILVFLTALLITGFSLVRLSRTNKQLHELLEIADKEAASRDKLLEDMKVDMKIVESNRVLLQKKEETDPPRPVATVCKDVKAPADWMVFMPLRFSSDRPYVAPYNPGYPREWIIQDAVNGKASQVLHHAQEIVYNAVHSVLDSSTDRVVVDVGANIGYVTLLAGSLGHRVFSFEPVSIFYKMLKMAVAANDFSKVDVKRLAMSDKKSKATVFVDGDSSSLENGNVNSKVKEDIETDRLDQVLKPAEPILLMKIDVQGYELKVLEGAVGLIKSTGVQNIIIEFWPAGIRKAGSEPVELLKLLYKLDFRCQDLHRDFGKKWNEDEFEKKVQMVQNLPAKYGYQTDLLCRSEKISFSKVSNKEIEESAAPVVVVKEVIKEVIKEVNIASINSAITLVESKHNSKLMELFKKYADMHRNSYSLSNKAKWIVLKHRLAMGLGMRVFHFGYDFLGNKLEGVISAMLLAIISNRVIVFEEPFLHSTLSGSSAAESKIDLDSLFESPDKLKWHLSDGLADKLSSLNKHDFVVIHGGPETKASMHAFLCDDLEAAYGKQDVWTIDTNQYFAPLLLQNANYQTKVRELFDGPDIFGTIFRYFFRPVEEIQKKIDKFRSEVLGLAPIFKFHNRNLENPFLRTVSSSIIFGLQIRSDDKDSPWAMDSYQQTQFFRCAEAVRSNNFPNVKEITLVVATDSSSVRKKSKDLANSDAFSSTLWGPGVKANVVWYDAPISRDAKDGVIAALVDIYAIASSDTIISSSSSTFGYVAHGLASKVPYSVGFRENCYREVSSQPCFHWWNAVYEDPSTMQCFDRNKQNPDSINIHTCWQGKYPDAYLKTFHKADKF